MSNPHRLNYEDALDFLCVAASGYVTTESHIKAARAVLMHCIEEADRMHSESILTEN